MKCKVLLTTLLLTFISTQPIYAVTPATNSTQSQYTNDQKEDGAILAWLIVLNKNEIALANAAIKRNLNPMVIKFAHLMIKQHTQNLNETWKVSHQMDIAPIQTSASTSLQENGQKKLSKLKTLDNKAFEKAYINAMVKGHAEASEAIQADIKQVHSPKLKRQLEATEKHVESHLDKAKTIQAKLH